MSSPSVRTLPKEGLISAKSAARLLGVSASTLARWRITGSPAIPFFKVGAGIRARVLYSVKDLDAFLEQSRFASTSEYANGCGRGR